MRVKELLSQHKKVVIGAGVALVVAALAIFFGLKLFGGGTAGDAVYVQKVSDVNAASGSATANRYAGVTEAQKVEKIELANGETIKQVFVKKGDHVKKGDPLFEYDNSLSEIKVQQAELEIEQLNTTIENDSGQIKELEQARSSSDDALAISAEIQELQAEIAQANYDLKLKETELKKLREAATDPKVAAPIDGTIQTMDMSRVGEASPSTPPEDGEDMGVPVLHGLDEGVDLRGDHGRLSGNVAGQHRSSAILTHGSCKGQDRPGNDPGPCNREDDLPEDLPVRKAQSPAGINEVNIHLLKGRTGIAVHQRESDHHGCDHAACPGLDDLDIKMIIQKHAKGPAL